jgi:hypothetical protein
MLPMGMPHLVPFVIEINRLETLCMAHLLQNGGFSGVGVANNQNSKALGVLFEY